MTNAQKNYLFLRNASALTRHTVTKNIADHYGISQGEAYEEVVDRFAEHLCDYMTGPERILVMDLMKAQGCF